MHRFILPFLCLLGMHIFAQQGQISGNLTNFQTDEKVAFATVMISKASDSSMVKGDISDENGGFSFSDLAYGSYRLISTAMGFEKYVSEVLELSAEKPTIKLGDVSLQTTATAISGVEIVSKRPFIERSLGKTVMNIESSPGYAGDNALEVLRKMPGVMIDQDENIKLNGKSGVLVMINDKQTYLSGDQLANYLKTLSADEIDKIEADASPSAKYEGDGVAGINTIKTKKMLATGFNGSVNAGIGYSDGGDVNTIDGFSLNLRLKKWTFYSGLDYFTFPRSYGHQWIRSYPYQDENISFEGNMGDNDEKWASRQNYVGSNFKFATDYEIDKKNLIGASFFYRGSNWTSESKSYNRYFHNEELDSSYFSQENTESQNPSYTFNLNFKHSFDTSGKVFFFDIDFLKNNSISENFSENEHYLGDIGEGWQKNDTRKSSYDPNSSEIISFKGDYVHPWSKKSKFEAGFKGSFVSFDKNLTALYNELPDVKRNNHFKFTENIAAVYGMLSHQFSKKQQIQLGLRAEYTTNKGEQKVYDSIFKKQYFSLFPSLSYSYQMNDNNNLDVGYRYRISRPNYEDMNPFFNLYDDNSSSSGNADLRPAYTHQIAFGYSWKYMIFFNLKLNHSKNEIEYLQYIDENRRLHSMPHNIGTQNAIGADLSFQKQLTSWWSSSNSISFQYNKNTLDYQGEIIDRESSYASLWSMQNFSFFKNYSVDLSGWVMRYQGIFDKAPIRTSISIGLKGFFLDRKLGISLSIDDPFNWAGKWESNSTYPDGSFYNLSGRYTSRRVYLRADYRFGNANIQARQRQAASAEEAQRAGGSAGGSGGGQGGQ